MPSSLPVIKVRTNEDNVVKIKTIAKYNNRSVSKEIEQLIEEHISQFETEHGKIDIEMLSMPEIIQDIKDRVLGNPPYESKD